jgi:anti-sigma regulatory factor (Ser/Thr protein kinase)
MTLKLRATPEEVMRAVEALQTFGQTRGVPEKALFGLALALEECGSNIVNHALNRDGRRKFQVSIVHTGSAVTIELRDRGPAFDPTQAGEPEPESRADDGPPGGWGIELVRRYMDDIRYRRQKGENILTLTRRLVDESPKK